MSELQTNHTAGEAAARFPSLASLRAAHSDLLKQHRERGEASGFLADVEGFIRQGRATGALLDIEDDRWASQSLLDYWATVLYRAGREPPDATLAEFDPALAPELDDEDCPYLGLDAFGEADHALFCGRQRLIEEMIRRLQEGRLLAVVGPSGSGKSSAVLAGLLPALKGGAIPGSGEWRYCPPMVPGSNPLANLARLPELCDVDAVEGDRQDPGHLAQVLGELGVPTVLVVDQFEELFTLCLDDEARQAFVDLLLDLVRTPEPGHRVILTMRIDFEPYVARLPAFQPLFEAAEVRVTPLSAGELREAIEEPGRRVGLRFQEGVVDALLQDILGEPAALPLLQFTLLKLWENRERNRVTWEAYRRLGGARQALASSADEFYEGLIPEEQVTARRALLRMVRPGEGLEVTSNRVRRETLYEAGEARDRIDRVLDKLIDARLVRLTEGDSPGDAQVEVAHEALVRNWPRLVSWLEDEREAMRQRLRLTAAAEQWETLARDPEALWRGSLLEAARRYGDLNDLEAEFVQASQAAVQRAEREKEAARQRELAQARALAEEQQRRAEQEADAAKRLGRLVKRLEIERQRAEGQARLARSRELAIAAISNLDDAPERSALLAWQAVSETYSADGTVTPEAEEALRRSDQSLRLRLVLRGHTDRLWSVAFSPDGTRLVTASSDGTAKVWDATCGVELLTLRDHSEAVIGVAFSPDGRLLATASDDGTAKVWDAASGRELFSLCGHADEVWGVAFSPDGTRLATASKDRTAKVWDAASGQELHSLEGHGEAVIGAAFGPDGTYLATASFDQTARVWDAALGEEIMILSDHSRPINGLTFSPDGRQLATASEDGTAVVRDLVSGDLHTLSGHGDPVWGAMYGVWNVAFSPDGLRLATASASGTANVWDLDSGEVVSLSGHAGEVFGVAFSPDGTRLATASFDGTAMVWDVRKHGDAVYGVAFSPDGTRLATASRDTTVRVWDRTSERQVLALRGHTDTVIGVAFSPDGTRLATASLDGGAKVWDAASGQELVILRGHDAGVWDMAFSPEGRYLATASLDGTVRVWDAAFDVDDTVKVWDATYDPEVLTLRVHGEGVWGVACSPDGAHLAVGDADGVASVWDLVSGQKVLALQGHSDAVSDVAFSPDGSRLATGSLDGLAKVWDVASGQEVLTLSGHADAVMGVAFGPGGRRLATGSADRTAKVWDAASGQETLTLAGHGGAVADVAFSPDGRYLAVASADKMAHVYLLSIEDLRAVARRRLTRSLTAEECQKYLHVQPCPPTVVGLLVEGKNQARAGDVQGAVASFQAALELDPTLDLDPAQEAGYFAAGGLVARGQNLARAGDVEGAVARFREALALDPSLALDPGGEAARIGASGLVAKGRNLARAGDVEGAAAAFREALALAPALPLDPEAESASFAAVGLVDRGRNLARSGDVHGAAAAFRQALALDSELPLDPEEEAGRLAAAGLLARGRNLAKTGDLDGAAASFRRALALDTSLAFDPEAEARQIAALELVDRGVQLLQHRETEEAILAYTRAQELVPDLDVPAEAWHRLCWFGSLGGRAAEVLYACERAVAMEPGNVEYLDSRGVARALAGDIEGAIEDLQAFVAWTEDDRRRAQRQRWIADLRTGRNPFTPDEIERLLGD